MQAVLGVAERERDQRLVELHRAGDPRGFADIYALYHPALLRFCQARVGDRHLAEEIAQEAFLRAFVALDRLRDHSRVYPWLTVIAKRLAVDHHRCQWRVHPMADVDAGEVPSAETELVERAEVDALRAALGRVRSRHREVLRMREQEGLSYEDIARAIGAPVTTVPPLLHRARRALRREYLAITETEWAAVVPAAFAGAAAALRRARDGVLHGLSMLPDVGVLAAPVATVVVAVGMLLTPTGAMWPVTPDVPASWVLPDPVGQAEAPSGRSSGGDAAGRAGDGRLDSVADGPPRGVAGLHVGTDEEGARWTRDHIREMPINFEIGDFAIGADPGAVHRTLDSTAAGDLSWTPGGCGEPDCGERSDSSALPTG